MRNAATYENGQVFRRFGDTTQMALAQVEIKLYGGVSGTYGG